MWHISHTEGVKYSVVEKYFLIFWAQLVRVKYTDASDAL